MTDQKEKHRKWLYIITAIVIIAGGGADRPIDYGTNLQTAAK